MESTIVALAPHYTPWAWAIPAHRSTAKTKVLWVHRRGGKGWFALHEGLAAYAQALREKPEAELVPGFHAWTVAPSFPQARQSETEIEAFLPTAVRPAWQSWDDSKGHSKADHTFVLLGSKFRRPGLWEVKSAHEPEALQTVGLDFLHVQECQDIPEAAFAKLLPTLRSPHRMGLSVWEGIPPDDPGHWFARLAHQAEEDSTGGLAFFRVPFDQNTDLPEKTRREIEADVDIMLEREWKRMYMVELQSGEGNFLGNVDGCITNAPLLEAPEDGHKYVMGLDLAKKVDYTVIIVMDACHRRVVWHRRIGSMDWNAQEEAVKYAASAFGVRRIRMDSTGLGDPLYDRFRYQGLPVEPFMFTNESKYQLLTTLAVAIEKHTIAYPSISTMLREMKALRAAKLPSGKSRIDAPGGGHDDYPMALAMAYAICDMPALDLSLWKDVQSSRYAPDVDMLVPGGIALPVTNVLKFWQRRQERRSEERRRQLESLGIDF